MSNNLKKFILSFLQCSLFALNLYACSYTLPPIRGFDNKEFIFIGTVTGYAGPFHSTSTKAEIWGVKVRMIEKVFLPQGISTESFEIIPYLLGSDCSENGIDIKVLQSELTVNSTVRVIAKLSTTFPHTSDDGATRLEIKTMTRGSLWLHNENRENETTASSVFIYSPENMKHWALVNFEVRKDLLRLTLAKTNKERQEILRRMRPLRFSSAIDVDYEFIANHYNNSEVKGQIIKHKKSIF